jgi:DNA repair protein RadA/Sms
MAKPRQVFVCNSCGAMSPRWMGKCPDCGTWDALEAHTTDPGAERDRQKGIVEAWQAVNEEGTPALEAPAAVPIAEAGAADGPAPRLRTGIGEFDRVLGGGIVPGSACWSEASPASARARCCSRQAGGSPARARACSTSPARSPPSRSAPRAQRLGVDPRTRTPDELFVLADTNLARLVEQAGACSPSVAGHRLHADDLQARPRSPRAGQCHPTAALRQPNWSTSPRRAAWPSPSSATSPRTANSPGRACLSTSSTPCSTSRATATHAHRIVRAVKNRFGTTLETRALRDDRRGPAPLPEGVMPSMDALARTPPRHRPLPRDVTARAACSSNSRPSPRPASSAPPNARAAGWTPTAWRCSSPCWNSTRGCAWPTAISSPAAVGGVRVVEPAADLALLAAVAGAETRRALPARTCVIGEVGLAGEVRPVGHLEQRLREAARLGYERAIIPKTKGARPPQGFALVQVESVQGLLEELGPAPRDRARTSSRRPD